MDFVENFLSNERNKLTTLSNLRIALEKKLKLKEEYFHLSEIAKIIKKCGFRRKRVRKHYIERNSERTIGIR